VSILVPGAYSKVSSQTTGRLPSGKSFSIPKILIQTTTTQESCDAPIASVHPVPLSPAARLLIPRRIFDPTANNPSPAIRKILLNPENPDSDNDHPRIWDAPNPIPAL